MRNLTLAQATCDAVYLCAACGVDGVVRVSVTRDPEGSIRRRSNIVAAQWTWIGSESRAKLLVRRLRRQWAARYVVGEGYRFDYGAEGGEFRDVLNQAFLDVVGSPAQWEKLGPRAIALVKNGGGARHESPRGLRRTQRPSATLQSALDRPGPQPGGRSG